MPLAYTSLLLSIRPLFTTTVQYMELELGLALPASSCSSIIPINKGFDLNSFAFDQTSETTKANSKRGFDEAFHDLKTPIITQLTLPLLLWSDKPNRDDDDDDRKTPRKTISCSIRQSDGEGNGIVGWPPIKSWRKKVQNYQMGHHYQREENNGIDGGINNGSSSSPLSSGANSSMYVKVKMEGDAIGRKVDLSLHHSYQTLEATLVDMFRKCLMNVNGLKKPEGSAYTLTYQDKEGDWLLVGDIPWQSFIQSVKRLKIQRNGN